MKNNWAMCQTQVSIKHTLLICELFIICFGCRESSLENHFGVHFRLWNKLFDSSSMTTEYDSKWLNIDLFPNAPFFSSWAVCLKPDQALSWVLDFCPGGFQMWKWGFILSYCLSDAHKRAWIRLDKWRWRKNIHQAVPNVFHDNKQPCQW